MMMDPRVQQLIDDLRAARLAELSGARLSVEVPLTERLLNRALALGLPPNGPVREVTVQPRSANRLRVRVRLSAPDFLPPIGITLEIVRQAALPGGPLVLRVLSMPWLVGLAGAAVSLGSILPPGVRLEDQQIVVDLGSLLERQGHGELIPFLERVHVTSEEGRVRLQLEARVP